MQRAQLCEAKNFRQVDDQLLTSGQPSEEQLASAAVHGVQVVIDLALHDDPRYSLQDEQGCVEGCGMIYVHIPVQFAMPTEADLLAFFDAIASQESGTLSARSPNLNPHSPASDRAVGLRTFE